MCLSAYEGLFPYRRSDPSIKELFVLLQMKHNLFSAATSTLLKPVKYQKRYLFVPSVDKHIRFQAEIRGQFVPLDFI